MTAKISVLFILTLATLLTGCNLPVATVEQAPPSETQAPSVPAAVATDTPQPTLPTTEALPTEPVVEIVAPTVTPTFLPPPSGPVLQQLASGAEPTISELHMVDALSGWATGGLDGNADHIFTTSDGGAQWADVTPPQPGEADSLVVATFFLDDSTAWATFSSKDTRLPEWPVVWRTSDGGQNWQPSQPLDLSNLDQSYATDLTFVDLQHGWLLTHVGVGMSHDYVTLFRTSDGGVTWARLLDPYTDGQIQGCGKTGMVFLDSQVGWLSGDCGGVMAGVFLTRTTDGGLTWTYIDLPAPLDNPQLYDVNAWAACGGYDLQFFEPMTAVLGVRCTLYDQNSTEPTFAHYLYTTLDGGTTWSSQPYPGGTLLFVSPQNGWALSRDIYQTVDGGGRWNLINTVYWDAHFNFISPEVGWAAAYTETEYALVGTTDGGELWFMLEPVISP